VIVGSIASEGVPIILVTVAGTSWPAIIDTGFNGDLELPANLLPFVNARFLRRNGSLLAAGQTVSSAVYGSRPSSWSRRAARHRHRSLRIGLTGQRFLPVISVAPFQVGR